MLLTKDLKEFLNLLNEEKVRYVVVGGWAFNFHATPRYTGDFDLYVEISDHNEQALRKVLSRFGFKSTLPPKNKTLLKPNGVIMFGLPPSRIDILTAIDNVSFSEAWESSEVGKIENVRLRFLSFDLLMKNKKAANRPKDIADLSVLKRIKRKAK
jgi:hypothetical protein